MTRHIAAVLALLAALGAVFLWIDRTAYNRGYAASNAKHEAATRATQAALDAGNEIILQKSADLERFRNLARTLAMEADNDITSDPVDNRCVPTDAERLRAKRRWQVAD